MMQGQAQEGSEMLAVDVGNRTTCFGLFQEDGLKSSWTVTTQPRATADEARLAILGFFASLEDDFSYGESMRGYIASLGSILSCSVPDLTNSWVGALRSLCDQRPLVVGPGLKTGIQMKVNDPSEVGPDRIADIVAARHAYGYPLVVIDCGMTVNFAVIDKDGAFIGGLIVPGIALSVGVLSEAAARLPVVGVSKPQSLIGKNTRDSMQSGIVNGEVARIDGLIDMIWRELGYETGIVLAGEDACFLAPLLGHEAHADDTLTLQGLRLLYEGSKKK